MDGRGDAGVGGGGERAKTTSGCGAFPEKMHARQDRVALRTLESVKLMSL